MPLLRRHDDGTDSSSSSSSNHTNHTTNGIAIPVEWGRQRLYRIDRDAVEEEEEEETEDDDDFSWRVSVCVDVYGGVGGLTG